MNDISIIVPIYNEKNNLPELYKRLVESASKVSKNYEILFVNDGSKDESCEIIKTYATKNANIRYINFSRNFGHQIAISAGIDKCNGNAIVIIDGDLQDPPELIPELYKKYKEGYNVVYAKRKSRKGEGFLKKTTAKFFYRILSKITSINIPLDTGDFRLFDDKILKHLRLMPEKHKFIRGQISWLGFKQTFIEYDRDSRKHGETKFTYKKMVNFAIDGITSFSSFPLKIVTLLGFIVSVIALIIIIYALYSKFVLDRVITGWTSLIISTMFIGGVQLLSIGIIGEYISRINSEVKNRPLYIIDEDNLSEN
ncbi:MAG: glycosyltransferase family 2 protein [Bacteroidetes bacterium]|nr:glycosyltransferase family 2 protein [Bacteroidota bacterium]